LDKVLSIEGISPPCHHFFGIRVGYFLSIEGNFLIIAEERHGYMCRERKGSWKRTTNNKCISYGGNERNMGTYGSYGVG
jgi:hypothetical protein